MKNNLLEICDEIFQSHRLPIYGRILESNKVTFPDYPWTGLTTAVENRLDCWTIYVQDPTGGRVYTQELVLPVLPSAVEQVLRFIHDDLDTYLDQPPPCDKKPIHKPEITLKIDENTPTSILRDLAARALGWKDFPYDSVEQGRLWHCGAQNAPFGPTIPKTLWKPDMNADQTLALIANLGINISVNHDEEEIKSRVLIEAAKIGARKLGEDL